MSMTSQLMQSMFNISEMYSKYFYIYISSTDSSFITSLNALKHVEEMLADV